MTQAFETPRVGRLIRQEARPEMRADGYPMAVDHVFAIWTGDEAAPLYPVRVTVETAVAEESGESVLAALEKAARDHLSGLLCITLDLSVG